MVEDPWAELLARPPPPAHQPYLAAAAPPPAAQLQPQPRAPYPPGQFNAAPPTMMMAKPPPPGVGPPPQASPPPGIGSGGVRVQGGGFALPSQAAMFQQQQQGVREIGCGYRRIGAEGAGVEEGVDVDVAHVNQLLQQRHSAKMARDFASADRIRDQLRAMGVLVSDRDKTWKVCRGGGAPPSGQELGQARAQSRENASAVADEIAALRAAAAAGAAAAAAEQPGNALTEPAMPAAASESGSDVLIESGGGGDGGEIVLDDY
jgi:hypothetical protein